MSHWDSPLGLATRHDKARARAEKLRDEARLLDEKADELERRYEEAMVEIRSRSALIAASKA